ncbi:MAG TPA: hypothetical protein VFO46_07210 [Candidatus Sulfotelmatobacter sp.]|nr:hypothetical protein [Candidatus Sulfotelmatobacter sp.]
MATTPFKHDDRRGPTRRDTTAEMCGPGPAAALSPANESPIKIDEAGIAELIAFFKILAKWDQEARCHEKMQ